MEVYRLQWLPFKFQTLPLDYATIKIWYYLVKEKTEIYVPVVEDFDCLGFLVIWKFAM